MNPLSSKVRDYQKLAVDIIATALAPDVVENTTFQVLLGYLTCGSIDLVSAGIGEMENCYGFIYMDKNNKGEGPLRR